MKQLIILSCIIPIGTQSEVKTRSRLADLRAVFSETFSQQLQDETNTIIRVIILPGKLEETKFECIYPKSPDVNVMQKLEEIMNNQNAWKL